MSNELITLDKYCEVSKTSLSFKREVTKDEWQKAFDACRHIEGCIQFWIGDLLKYREQKWGMYDDISEQTGIEKDTLRKYKETAEGIESGIRIPDLSYTHHRVLVGLDKKDQQTILQLASKNKLTVKETKDAVKELKHVNKKETELPDNKYGVIYADPPWSYGQVQTGTDGSESSSAAFHYPTMSIEQICNLKIKDLSKKDCVLFIWATSPNLEFCFPVITAWGFEYKSSFIWDKVRHNVGHYNSVRHELLLIATKGKGTPDNVKLYDSVQSIEKTAKHSEKPDEFRKIIETLYPERKKIELFSREKHEGWDSWGNEL